MSTESLERQRQWRVKHRALGLCSSCKLPRLPNHSMCQWHKDVSRLKQQKRDGTMNYTSRWHRDGAFAGSAWAYVHQKFSAQDAERREYLSRAIKKEGLH